ncbi:hypothetical protein [Sphingopyxis indica]|uniref:Uncharacterized protein n=1 Tax=Sphingopyxis indica TaxID=436663 RepID=A0A239KRA1_9SPHN|nr:hypothetical protein [Sphingopyxis indica]SNT20262.1 hypothetical protein SAMN06295955_115102 [Sphingopyxis indica]
MTSDSFIIEVRREHLGHHLFDAHEVVNDTVENVAAAVDPLRLLLWNPALSVSDTMPSSIISLS